jgi:ComF family protein
VIAVFSAEADFKAAGLEADTTNFLNVMIDDLKPDPTTNTTGVARNLFSWWHGFKLATMHTAIKSTVVQPIRKAVAALRDFLLPPRCLNCRTQMLQDNALCPSCWQHLTLLTLACSRCALPLAAELAAAAGDGEPLLCGQCLSDPPPFTAARAAWLYDAHSAPHLLAFKHGDRLDYSPWLARLLWQAGADVLQDADFLLPVPLHWRRQWQRRYNQAAELAKDLSRLSQVPTRHGWLLRRKSTHSQGGLHQGERQRNVAHAFVVKPSAKALLKGAKVVLIDDVLTTGATATACTTTLLRAGAAEVRVLTVARVARNA